jgi:hypothetical protein
MTMNEERSNNNIEKMIIIRESEGFSSELSLSLSLSIVARHTMNVPLHYQ